MTSNTLKIFQPLNVWYTSSLAHSDLNCEGVLIGLQMDKNIMKTREQNTLKKCTMDNVNEGVLLVTFRECRELLLRWNPLAVFLLILATIQEMKSLHLFPTWITDPKNSGMFLLLNKCANFRASVSSTYLTWTTWMLSMQERARSFRRKVFTPVLGFSQTVTFL